MSAKQLLLSLDSGDPILQTSPILRALLLDHQGRWAESHEVVHDENDPISAAVHAYLHRKEGDSWNANYWYRRAGRRAFVGSLEKEWEELVECECARLKITSADVSDSSSRG